MNREPTILSGLLFLLLCSSLSLTAEDSNEQNKPEFAPPEQKALKPQKHSWEPPGSGHPLPEELPGGLWLPDVTITHTPKPTADISKFDQKYVIDLESFGISNQGRDPQATSRGLNAAFRHAESIKANHIVFPKGTYLISENEPLVLTLKNTIVDLNGSTLQINPNGLKKYSIVEILPGAENLRLTNGEIRGDLDKHDFTEEGVHAWGHGLTVHGGRNLEIDHLTITGTTGDGANSRFSGARNREELLESIIHTLYAKHFEPGGFDEKGLKAEISGLSRTISPLDISGCGGEFEFGYSTGYLGFPFVRGRVYRACFYDSEMALLSHQRCLQFRKIEVPAGAKFLHLELNQPEVIAEPVHSGAGRGSFIGRISNYPGSVDVHFHQNRLIGNQRLGLGYCGGRRWLIEDNLFAENGGVSPSYGIDLEDGYEFMQDVVIRNNHFRDNRAGDLVICAGSELLIEGNHFENNVGLHGRPHNYTFRNNHFTGGRVAYKTRTGAARIENNLYRNCSISIRYDTAAVADGLNRRSGQIVATPPIILKNETLQDVTTVTGTYIHFKNSKIKNTRFVAGEETASINFERNEIEASSIHFETEGPPVKVDIRKNRGSLPESGPGIEGRKQTSSAP